MGSMLSGHVEYVRRGVWRLVVEVPGESRKRRARTVRATGKKAAEDGPLLTFIAELEDELGCGDDSTLAGMCSRWVKVRTSGEKPWRPKTCKFYGDNLRLHILPELGAVKARQLKPADLALFYAKLADEGLSESSRHHVHATIRAAFSWAMRNGIVDRNPAPLVDRPPQQEPYQASVWSHEQVATALREAAGLGKRPPTPQLVYVPIALGAWAGLRCGEMCALRWTAVDLDAGTLRVVAGLSQTAGGELHEHGPKARERVVPLPSQAVALLGEHKRRQDTIRRAMGESWNPEGYVLTRQDGRPVKPSNLSSAWARFCRVHKLPQIRLHDLRHSFATSIFEQGGEAMLKVVQELLGHSDPAITARIYLHTTPRQLQEVTAEQESRIASAERSAAKRALRGH